MTKKGFTLLQLAVFLMIAGVIAVMAGRTIMLSTTVKRQERREQNVTRLEDFIFNYSVKRFGMGFPPPSEHKVWKDTGRAPLRLLSAFASEYRVGTSSPNFASENYRPNSACERYTPNAILLTDLASGIAYFITGARGGDSYGTSIGFNYEGYPPPPLSSQNPAGTIGALGSLGTGGALSYVTFDETYDLAGCLNGERHIQPAVTTTELPDLSLSGMATDGYYAAPLTTGAETTGYHVDIPISFNYITGYRFMPDLTCSATAPSLTALGVAYSASPKLLEEGSNHPFNYIAFHINAAEAAKFPLASATHEIIVSCNVNSQRDNEGALQKAAILPRIIERPVYTKTLNFTVAQ